MSLGSNLGDSFGYAKDALFGNIKRWILLIIASIIFPFMCGYTVRVMSGVTSSSTQAPEADNWIKMLIDGILYLIIGIVYAIPLMIIAFVLGGAGIFAAMASPSAALAGGSILISFVVILIVAIIIGLFETIALVNFSRKGSFGAAFAFGDILAKIKAIGWISLFISILVYAIIVSIIYFILMLIPVIGWLLLLIFLPLFSIWGARFFATLYDSA